MTCCRTRPLCRCCCCNPAVPLHSQLQSLTSWVQVPFLVLGNKIDVPSAASEDELRHALGLASSITGKGKVDLKERPDVRPLEIFMCSVVRAALRLLAAMVCCCAVGLHLC